MHEAQIDSLRAALQHSPDNPPLVALLAQALMDAARHQEAIDTWRHLLRLEPGRREAKLGLARCYFSDGKEQAAAVICEELLVGRSDDAPVQLLLARCQYRLGNLDAAAAAYRAAIIADPAIDEPALAALLDDGGGDRSAGAADWECERPQIDFSQVGGMQDVKEAIRMAIIHPLANAELFKAYGKRVGGGVLLYGPPGCGKTHLARATAGEVNAHFISVGITDVLDMWIGKSEHNLQEIFATARRRKPCVLFFDEIDALAANRRDLRMSGNRNLINQFLAELDGIGQQNDGLLTIGATNTPWHLDAAFRRPGRFDKIIFVPPPDQAARVAVLHVLLADKPTERIDVEAVAKKTEHCSGADLKGLIDSAVEEKLREAMASGTVQPLTTRDLLAAAKRIRPTTREWLEGAKNHALYANQDGTYDAVLDHLRIKR